jgi:hypothetical protein
VLTLDRIVSLSDFADFARAFAGVAKAAVTWLWDGEKRIVHLTIAGEDGEVLDESTETYQHLREAIDLARDPNQPVRVDSYLDRPCRLTASIRVDPAYEAAAVQATVRARLVDQLAFDARDLGQALTSSEVVALVQQVEGVVMVDLDVLDKKPGSLLRARIPANLARWNGTKTEGAELLRAAAADIVVTVKA